MSVDMDEFESREGPAEATNAERVLAFLAENDDRAFLPDAIAAETGVDRDSVGPVLTRLRERGLVRHRSPYWAITDDHDRVREAVRDEEGPVEALVSLLSEPVEELLS